MKFKISLLSFIIAFSSLHFCFALTKYDIKAKMDTTNQLFSGTQQVIYTNTCSNELSEMYLILFPNLMTDKNPYISELSNDYGYLEGFDPAWLKIDGISNISGQPMQYEYVKAPATISKYSLDKVLLKGNYSGVLIIPIL
ncbi:MAG: hypothetical protein FD145_1357 [Candidatus Saganbacteria bacterium]|uniref:Uncharacterized protein n=1 Tax=Candidatus Saganbacteria bacterium TaxID=2575572 RepID=A0A833NY31_UNCSA|nr:MAG: hypothetical protein FD145_1357 [Candidatus Saganbacteria bacterium]